MQINRKKKTTHKKSQIRYIKYVVKLVKLVKILIN